MTAAVVASAAYTGGGWGTVVLSAAMAFALVPLEEL